MARVLIIESNPPDLLQTMRESGQRSDAEIYRDTLVTLQADLDIHIAFPYLHSPNDTDFYAPYYQTGQQPEGVIFTGSAVSWSTDAPEAQPLRTAMEWVFEKGWPGFGSCNGLQLAVTVLGGQVRSSLKGFEVGLAKNVRLTEQGQIHPMMQGRQTGFAASALHRDEVATLPEGAVTLAYNMHSPHQAMAYEKNGVSFWGTQYHPELSTADLAVLLKHQTGIFDQYTGLVTDLSVAETDACAAQRLGGTTELLQPSIRMLELRNWLGHINQRIS